MPVATYEPRESGSSSEAADLPAPPESHLWYEDDSPFAARRSQVFLHVHDYAIDERGVHMTADATTSKIRIDVPSGIGWTALLASTVRDSERAEAVPLVRDPWARMFAAAASPEVGRKIPSLGPTPDKPRSELWAFLTSYILARTLFIDEQVESAIADGARQVVLLAAGLDSRAARLDYPGGIKVFEVDREPVLAFKSAVLASHNADVARRVAVIADLTGDWLGALRQAGWHDDVPTCWVAEGILMYLGQPQAAALVASLRGVCAAGDRLVTEYFSRSPMLEDFRSLNADDREVVETACAMMRQPPPAPPAWAQNHRRRNRTPPSGTAAAAPPVARRKERGLQRLARRRQPAVIARYESHRYGFPAARPTRMPGMTRFVRQQL
jgi:methyltransferase (TIGR00027 family)